MTTPSIVVPIDFSDCSGEVVQKATELAEELGGRLTLLHVIQHTTGVSDTAKVRADADGQVHTALEVLRAEAKLKLPFYRKLAEDRGLSVETVVETGDPVDSILRHAAGDDVRFVVMGTHGRKGLSRLLLGSTAEKILNRATVPVITVKFEHKSTCEAGSCGWCASGVTDAQRQLAAEGDG